MKKFNFYPIFLLGVLVILFNKTKGANHRKLSNSSYIVSDIEEKQYLPNLIQLFVDFNAAYLDIVKFSNGDIIIEFLNEEMGGPRIFFGLKVNGNYLYGNKKVMSNESFISINDGGNSAADIVSFISKDENNNEHMISLVDAYEFYFDIYDFDLKIKKEQKYGDVFNFYNHIGMISFIEIKESNIYYTIICGSFYNKYDDEDDEIDFKLFKINFQNEETANINIISSSTIEIKLDSGLYFRGCYDIELEKIICFIYNNDINMDIYVFSYALEKEDNQELSFPNFDNSLFKCIHLKNNIGSIIYLTTEDTNFYLNLKFLDHEDGNSDYFPSIKYQIDNNQFSDNTNNFIKISENKICFIAQSTTIIDIYLIYLYEQEEDDSKKVVIREYNLNTISLYNINNYQILKSVIYNNNIALGLNYKFPNEDNRIYGGLIIIGYANSTDYDLDLEGYIANENNLNLEIDLKNYLVIENNYFGYEYSGTIIIDLANCNSSIQLYSSKNPNKEIEINTSLEKDETIKFDLELKDYNPFECLIEYRTIVSEPDLQIFDNYPDNMQNSESEENFISQKGEYIGRQSSYKIILNSQLTNICESDCNFCQKTGEKKCLINNINDQNGNESEEKIEEESEEEKKLRNYMNSINATEVDSVTKNLESILNNVEPDSSYLIKQKYFTLVLNKLNEYNEKSTVNLDFSECEKKLRENLPSDTILRIVQVNIESQNENILNDQVEYKVYDQNNKEIDLSVCNTISITVENKITNTSKLNMDKILDLKNSGVDLFNIKDEFFNDICRPYSDKESDSDMILSDRVKDLFQNFSVCGDGCEYNSFNETKMAVNCKCKIKQEISEEREKGNFAESIEGVFLYSNFGLIKCYELFFSLEGKIENIGFIVFTTIILGHIPGYIFYFIGRINPIKNYLKNEMKNAGYLTKDEEKQSIKDDKLEKKDKNHQKKKEKMEIIKSKEKRKKKHKHPHNPKKRKNKLEIKDKNEDNKDINIRNKNNNDKRHKTTKHRNNLFITTQETENLELNVRKNRKYSTQKINKESIHLKNIMENNEEHLIRINAYNNTDNDIPPNSNYNLDNYNYEEASIYEKRSYPRIFFIFLMNTEKILNTFVYKQPLELKPLRISLFLFNISCDIALNAFFYLSDNISDKYHYKGSNQFLFSLTNNIAISIVSAIIGFILIFFFQNLVRSTNEIRKIFGGEEDLMKKNKEYKVDKDKKIEIKNKIRDILNCLKKKIIIFFVVELILMLFFLYYITVFCQVYKKTQISWIYDVLVSYLFSFLASLGISFVFSITYVIAYKNKIKNLYYITLLIYNYT